MTITFLGTGTSQGVPVIGCTCQVCKSLDHRDKRLRSSIHILKDDLSFIIDSGPDFRQQVLREQIKRLDALLFTHGHKDHTAGMDDVRSFNFLQGEEIPVYTREEVLEQLRKEYSYIFSNHTYPGVPRVGLNEIGNKPFDVKGVSFTPIEVMHYKLPVLGFRIDDFTYITDANRIEASQLKKIRGSRVLVLNALQIEPHISHFNLSEAIDVITDIGPETAYLTHLSHKLGLHSEISAMLPSNVKLAYDGLKINL